MRRTGNKDSLKGLQKGKCTDSKPCVISYFMKHSLPTQFWLPWNRSIIQDGFKLSINILSLPAKKQGLLACTVIPSQVILYQKVIFYHCVFNKENKGILDIFFFWWSKYVWKLIHFKLHSYKLKWFLILLVWCTYCSLSRPE